MSSAEIPSEGVVPRVPSKDTGSERGPAARIAARTSLGVFAALQVSREWGLDGRIDTPGLLAGGFY